LGGLSFGIPGILVPVALRGDVKFQEFRKDPLKKKLLPMMHHGTPGPPLFEINAAIKHNKVASFLRKQSPD
jgi:hypothetical protein